MQKKRFNLPPLDLIQGFEAAARNLSFTKAAEELFITQSAVSRQIRGAGGASGRRPVRAPASRAGAHRAGPRALRGRRPICWSGCRSVTDRLRADGATPHLTVTTTSGFASLWLIPRLRGLHRRCTPTSMCASPPATSSSTLERSLVDVAVRYCQEEEAPEGAIRLFGEELFPVCSPALLTEGPHPLRTLQDLRAPRAAAHGRGRRLLSTGAPGWRRRAAPTSSPRPRCRFDGYEQMIGAALSGQGVAMGIGRLVSGLVEEGRLVAPFAKSVVGPRAYYVVRSALTGTRPHVQAFVDWLVGGGQDRRPSPSEPASAAQLPTTSGEVRRRKRGEHAQGGDAPGARVLLGGDVLDGHGEVRGVGLDDDGVRVARHGRGRPTPPPASGPARCRRATAPPPR